MQAKIEQLKAIQAEIADLGAASSVLGWDQQVNMPNGAAQDRGNQLATLGKLIHMKAIAPEVGQLINDLSAASADLDPDSDEARLIKVSKRAYDQAVKVPPEFSAEMARVTSAAFSAWALARAEKDFSKFQPHLEKIVRLAQQYVEFFAPYEHPYDVLLDRFEPGMKTVDVQAIFNALRPQQVELIQAIAERPQVDDSFLRLDYDEQKQWDFGVGVISKYGYDWERGRQDKSAHPFTTNFSVNDVRITTRVDKRFINTALFGTLHECGHALYEQGVAQMYNRTALAGGASLAIHESQSRMYENLVGRSLAFWEYFYPSLQETFPSQLGNLDLQTFYRGINKVNPSLIRVEADEATYNLHIMLRLELEIAMLEGSLAVKDLPEAWNDRFEEYLGIRPPNDAVGVLQDIHWSNGLYGYFPTYALGNLISAQLWEKITAEIPDLEDQFRQGQFEALLGWLRGNIHRHGSKFEPQELVQRATGDTIDPAAYMRYLTGKYSTIYGL